MELFIGKSILEQVVFGRLRFFQRTSPEVAQFSQLSWQEEEERFEQAQRRAVLELAALYDQTSSQVGEGIAAIFAIHAMLLEDEDFVESIRSLIRQEGATAEHALQVVARGFGDAFAAMDSPYMRARAADIRDISRRVMGLLLEQPPQDPLREGPAILFSDEFFPSEVLNLDHRKLLGLAAQRGSVDSHTAMLLRAYGIPAMVEVALAPAWDGHLALMDGFAHRLYLDPDQELMETLRVRYQSGMPPSKG